MDGQLGKFAEVASQKQEVLDALSVSTSRTLIVQAFFAMAVGNILWDYFYYASRERQRWWRLLDGNISVDKISIIVIRYSLLAIVIFGLLFYVFQSHGRCLSLFRAYYSFYVIVWLGCNAIFIQRFGKLDVDSKSGQRIFLGAALFGLLLWGVTIRSLDSADLSQWQSSVQGSHCLLRHLPQETALGWLSSLVINVLQLFGTLGVYSKHQRCQYRLKYERRHGMTGSDTSDRNVETGGGREQISVLRNQASMMRLGSLRETMFATNFVYISAVFIVDAVALIATLGISDPTLAHCVPCLAFSLHGTCITRLILDPDESTTLVSLRGRDQLKAVERLVAESEHRDSGLADRRAKFGNSTLRRFSRDRLTNQAERRMRDACSSLPHFEIVNPSSVNVTPPTPCHALNTIHHAGGSSPTGP